MTSSRATIPRSFAVEACLDDDDGYTLVIRNNLSIPMSVKFKGDVGKPWRTESDFGIGASVTRAVTRAISHDPDILLPGDTLHFPIGPGSAKFGLWAGPKSDWGTYEIASAVAQYIPGKPAAVVNATTALVKELTDDYRDHQTCMSKAGKSRLKQIACAALLYRNIEFALTRAAVSVGLKRIPAAILTNVTYTRWVSESVKDVGVLAHSGYIKISAEPKAPQPKPAPPTTTAPPAPTTTTPVTTPTTPMPTPAPGPAPTPTPVPTPVPPPTTYTHVTPLGPTSGPSGFSVGIGIPACPSPNSLYEYADGQVISDTGGSGDSYPSSAVAYAPWPFSPSSLSVGTHQLTFDCHSVATGSGTINTLWTDPGFSVDVTAAQTPTSVVSTTVPFGGNLNFNSGAPAGSAPCPVVQGLTATGLNPLLVDSDYVIQDYKNIVPSATDTTEALGITASDEDEIDYAGMSCNYAPVGETWRNTSTYLYMFGYTRVTISSSD